jgi:hypothetical protein
VSDRAEGPHSPHLGKMVLRAPGRLGAPTCHLNSQQSGDPILLTKKGSPDPRTQARKWQRSPAWAQINCQCCPPAGHLQGKGHL